MKKRNWSRKKKDKKKTKDMKKSKHKTDLEHWLFDWHTPSGPRYHWRQVSNEQTKKTKD